MKSFTKTEITWMIGALRSEAEQRREQMNITRSSTLAALYEARANDFDGLADRLQEAVDNNNKRIEIK